ncbi:hypothetical protein BGZ47_005699 [Haplosporangium gracile]|nr:hypothetical protein BGZ47_005699 [Haplosporangium gracile]
MAVRNNNNGAAPTFDVINHPVKDTLLIVSCLLSKLVHKNDSYYNPLKDPITLFHSRAVPRISIEAYLARILQYIPFTNEVLLNVLVFLDRIGGLEGMQMHQGGLLTTPSTSTTCSSNTTATAQCNALYSAPGPVPVSVSPSQSEAEAETTTTTDNKRSKYKAVSPSSSMPSPPLAAATSPVPEPVQPATGNGFRINSFNIHRLLITSLMIAAKFTSDLFYSNARYAKVGGLALPELNQLELEFLFTSKFELNVKVDELQRVGNSLLQFRDRWMVPSLPFPFLQLQQSQTMTMMAMQRQQLQFQAQLQAQIQATAQIQAQAQARALALKQQQQAGSLLSPPEEKRPWDENATVQNDHSYYTH